MDEVVPTGLISCLGAKDGAGEPAKLSRNVTAFEDLVRACHHMLDHDTRNDLDRRELGAGRRAGEDLHFSAPLCEPAGGLDHIDVQTARVAAARLVEWRRMDADHRHPTR